MKFVVLSSLSPSDGERAGGRGSLLRLLTFSALTFALLGCHKKEAEVINQSQNPSDLGTPVKTAPDAKAAQSLPAPPPKVAANADNYVRENVTGQIDPNLTAQLRSFVEKYGRLPQSFTEFANRGLDSMPRPPEGCKWVIDAPNQQVKSVPMK
jgi:hypothetical protein